MAVETTAGVSAASALLDAGTAPGSALLLRALLEAARLRYVGRPTTLCSRGSEVRLVPTAVASSGLGARALTTGRFATVTLAARDVVRPGLALRGLTVTAADVRLRPGLTPELVAGPVEIEAELDPDWVAGRLREHVPQVEVGVDADGVARARLRRRPGLGAADLAVSVDGHTLSWKVTGLTVAGRWMGPPRSAETRRSVRAMVDRSPLAAIRSGRVELPGLPGALRLHGLDLAPGRILVRGGLDGWRRTVPLARIDDVLRGALSLLDLSR
ncbi:LmeA family phospholipid-binding protein [Pseudonocardia sp. ICBG601]|uniref:LmeA family phospholipid-binding protein n=1 Tax=Pseudonocardia sp. ICBG601 TaxID=2846759 RepID=UPI001CF6B21B|nr:LmeA family phospholipid-binding protein [Pseudonocardia sp. ICBG601]